MRVLSGFLLLLVAACGTRAADEGASPQSQPAEADYIHRGKPQLSYPFGVGRRIPDFTMECRGTHNETRGNYSGTAYYSPRICRSAAIYTQYCSVKNTGAEYLEYFNCDPGEFCVTVDSLSEETRDAQQVGSVYWNPSIICAKSRKVLIGHLKGPDGNFTRWESTFFQPPKGFQIFWSTTEVSGNVMDNPFEINIRTYEHLSTSWVGHMDFNSGLYLNKHIYVWGKKYQNRDVAFSVDVVFRKGLKHGNVTVMFYMGWQ